MKLVEAIKHLQYKLSECTIGWWYIDLQARVPLQNCPSLPIFVSRDIYTAQSVLKGWASDVNQEILFSYTTWIIISSVSNLLSSKVKRLLVKG